MTYITSCINFSIEHTSNVVVLLLSLFCRLEKGRTNITVLDLQIFNTQNYIFQNLSLVFILEIFLKFPKFQPRYSYKTFSYKKKSTMH